MTVVRSICALALVSALAGCGLSARPNQATLDAQLSARVEDGGIVVEGARYVPTGGRFLAATFCQAAALAGAHNAGGMVFLGGVDDKLVFKDGVLHQPVFRFRAMARAGEWGLAGADQPYSERDLKAMEDGVFIVEDAYEIDPRVYSVAAVNSECAVAGSY